jgi:hypothetical protein
MKKRLLVGFGISLGIIVYAFLFVNFIQNNFWWVVPAYLYILYFFTIDLNNKRKSDDKTLMLKNLKDVRIDFW